MTTIRVPFLPRFLPLLCCAAIAAQEDAAGGGAPPPAPELAKLKPLAGSWRGSGTAVMAPGAPAAKWTGQVRSEWVLGGHWLQTDGDIAFEGGEQMRFREYFGWDRENQRYVQLAVNNMGDGVLVPVHFVGDDRMVAMVPRLAGGMPETERAVTHIGKDSQSFVVTFLHADGAAVDAVVGKFERVDKAAPGAIEAAPPLAPADPAMTQVMRMAGRYAIAGEMTMAPGAPAMQIRGNEVIRSLFGGSILQSQTIGTADGMPGTYEAHGYFAWDPMNRCYKVLMLSSMGEVMQGEARFLGPDKMVQTYAVLHMGQPCVARSVLHLDAQGRPVKAVNHSCMGDAPPMQDFSCTYTPATAGK